MVITLTCKSCGTEYQHDAQGGRRPDRCPPCRVARQAEVNRAKTARYRERFPERSREQWNKSNRKRLADPEYVARRKVDRMFAAYGMTPDNYEAMLSAQGGLCAICGGGPNGPGKRLHVDHCHDSNRVRGLVCAKCNTAVGLLDDDPARADALAAYLRS